MIEMKLEFYNNINSRNWERVVGRFLSLGWGYFILGILGWLVKVIWYDVVCK